MIIRELTLNGFKRFDEAAILLDNGLTIITGKNEAGKSTVLEALLAALFASPRSRARNVEDWTTWGRDDRPRLTLRYEAGGREFVLSKDFEAAAVSLHGTDGTVALTDEKRVHALISDHLGIGSRELFLGTVCVRHDELAAIAAGSSEMKDRLQQVITGGQDVSARKVIKALEDKIAEINRGMDRPAARPGPRRTLTDKIESIRQRRLELVAEAERHRQLGAELARIEAEIIRTRESLESKSSLLEKNRRYRDGQDRISDLGEKFREVETRLSRLREIEDEQVRASSRTESLARFASAHGGVAEIARIDGAIEEFRHAEELERSSLSDSVGKERGGGLIAAIAGGVVLLTTGGYMGYAVDPLFYIAAALGAALVGYAAARWNSARGRSEIEGIVRMRAEEMHARAVAAEEERRRILERFGVVSLPELQEGYRLYQEAASGQDHALRGEMQGLLGARTREELMAERMDLAMKIAACEQAAADGLAHAALSPEEFHELGEDVRKMEAHIRVLGETAMRERTTRDAARGAAEELSRAEELLAEAQDGLARLDHRLMVYGMAAEGMTEALTATLSTARDVLERDLAGYMSRITAGRYDAVSVGEEDLSLTLYSREKLGELAAHDMSRGTKDQLYLSARLALADIVCGGKRPPFILDDPFTGFDDNRLAGAMEVLAEFAADRQVILFTCHDRYSRFGGVVKSL